MNAKIRAMMDVLELMKLSKEEQVLLIRHLQEMWNISEKDLFPSLQLVEGIKRIEDLCQEIKTLQLSKEKAELSSVTDETKTVSEDVGKAVAQPINQPKQPKLSKNGKRLGRPPKSAKTISVSTDTEKTSAETKGTVVTEEEVANTDAVVAGEAKIADEPITDNVIHLVDAEQVEGTEKLKMGKYYDFEIIYKWDNLLYVKSHYVLSGLYPEGVCIKYEGNIKPEYSQFAISLSDEFAGVTIYQAKAYAANKLPRFEGERWKIMDFAQQSMVRKVSADLNRLLNKLSGDAFRGSYAVGGKTELLKQGVKIRYAIDIK